MLGPIHPNFSLAHANPLWPIAGPLSLVFCFPLNLSSDFSVDKMEHLGMTQGHQWNTQVWPLTKAFVRVDGWLIKPRCPLKCKF